MVAASFSRAAPNEPQLGCLAVCARVLDPIAPRLSPSIELSVAARDGLLRLGRGLFSNHSSALVGTNLNDSLRTPAGPGEDEVHPESHHAPHASLRAGTEINGCLPEDSELFPLFIP